MGDDFENFFKGTKAGVTKTLVKQKLLLYSLYFPENTLMFTESFGEFSDLHSIFGLRAFRYCNHKHVRPHCFIFTASCGQIDWNWLIWQGKKYLKIDWSVKMPLHLPSSRICLLWEMHAPIKGEWYLKIW